MTCCKRPPPPFPRLRSQVSHHPMLLSPVKAHKQNTWLHLKTAAPLSSQVVSTNRYMCCVQAICLNTRFAGRPCACIQKVPRLASTTHLSLPAVCVLQVSLVFAVAALTALLHTRSADGGTSASSASSSSAATPFHPHATHTNLLTFNAHLPRQPSHIYKCTAGDRHPPFSLNTRVVTTIPPFVSMHTCHYNPI